MTTAPRYYKVVGLDTMASGQWRVTLRQADAPEQVGIKTIIVEGKDIHRYPAGKIIVYGGEHDEARRGDPPGFAEIFGEDATT